MDPNALIASLQQSGAQFTPAQIQQIQNQLQQQQQQHQPQNQNDVGGSDSNTSVPQLSMPNVPNMNHFFPAPTMAAPQQAPVAPMNVTTNQTANPAFPFALLGASPLQQQLAALSGFPQVQHQQQQQLMQNNNDPNALHPKPQAPTAVPNLPVQQPQQMQTWNPQQQLQIQPQPQPFVNPFLPALMPMHLQQQLQQQFLAQQMLQLSGGGGGGNAMAANHLLAALLASQQQQPQPQQQPQHLGSPNPLPNFAAPAPSDTPKGPTDGKSGGEVEWTKPFAGKVKKESPFPMKLYQILSNPECQECICWNPHGRSWRILKPPVFEQVVIPLYFRHAKYASFMRQVNGWGFKRVVTGSDHNSYYHEYFVRDNPQLCLQMKRIKKKDGEFAGGRRDDDGSEDDEGSPVEKVGGDNEKRLDSASMLPPTHPPTPSMPTQSPNDLLQFAGMAGLNPVLNPATATALNGSAMAQPNFLMNGMLPAAALLAANPQAALMNGVNPFAMPGFPAAMPDGSIPMIPGMPAAVSNPPVPPATPVANSNISTTSQPPSQMVNSLTNALSGMDSDTLAKLQEIVNSGGTESLLQHLQQQQQQPPVGNIAAEKAAEIEVKVEEDLNPADEDAAGDEDDDEEEEDGDTYEA